MRIVWALLIVILGAVLVSFAFQNKGQTVDVHLWTRSYSDVEVWRLALVSLGAGCLFTAVLALIEGAKIRLDNRALRKRIAPLESELHRLRTQSPRVEPDSLPVRSLERADLRLPHPEPDPPSAPVYETDEGESEDDTYSGGRAV
jgi:hypothetical protein